MNSIEKLAMFRLKIKDIDLKPRKIEILQIQFNRNRQLLQNDQQQIHEKVNQLHQSEAQHIAILKQNIAAEVEKINKYGVTAAELNIFKNDKQLSQLYQINSICPPQRAKSATTNMSKSQSHFENNLNIRQLENQLNNQDIPSMIHKENVDKYMQSVSLSYVNTTYNNNEKPLRLCNSFIDKQQILQTQLDIIQKHERCKSSIESKIHKSQIKIDENNKSVRKVLFENKQQQVNYQEKNLQKQQFAKQNMQQLENEIMKANKLIYKKHNNQQKFAQLIQMQEEQSITEKSNMNQQQIDKVLEMRQKIEQFERDKNLDYLRQKKLLEKQQFQMLQSKVDFLEYQQQRSGSVSCNFANQNQQKQQIKQENFFEKQKLQEKIIQANQRQAQQNKEQQISKQSQRSQSALSYLKQQKQKLEYVQDQYIEKERVPQHIKLTRDQIQQQNSQQLQKQLENQKQHQKGQRTQLQQQRWDLINQKVRQCREIQNMEMSLKQFKMQENQTKRDNLLENRRQNMHDNNQLNIFMQSINNDELKKQIILEQSNQMNDQKLSH